MHPSHLTNRINTVFKIKEEIQSLIQLNIFVSKAVTLLFVSDFICIPFSMYDPETNPAAFQYG